MSRPITIEMGQPRESTCAHCGAPVYLVKTGPDVFKWVADKERPKRTWKCNPTRVYPVRSHVAKEWA